MLKFAEYESYNNIQEKYAYMPFDYKVNNRFIETTPSIEPKSLFLNSYVRQPRPIFNIFSDKKKYKTTKPIIVKIYFDDGLFFVENENLMISGYGETPEEAIKEFGMHIIYYYNHYNKIGKNKLSGDGLRLKELFSNLLQEE